MLGKSNCFADLATSRAEFQVLDPCCLAPGWLASIFCLWECFAACYHFWRVEGGSDRDSVTAGLAVRQERFGAPEEADNRPEGSR